MPGFITIHAEAAVSHCLPAGETISKLRRFCAAGLSSGTPCGTYVRGVFANVRRGMIPAHIYNDKELFTLEKERLFSRAWTFVAHESEIPQDGDYVVRRVLDDSFIIARDSVIMVMLDPTPRLALL